MLRKLGKIGVLMGGRSAEREVSLMSGNGVLAALLDKGIDAHGFDTGKQNLMALANEQFDRVFIALHGRYGEDGTIQGALELMGIPYTGSGVMASAIAMDKAMTKRLWQAQGLPTPAFEMLIETTPRQELCSRLGLPMIIKAAHEGSSLGIAKVERVDQLAKAYLLAQRFDPSVIAEAFVDGLELTCAILEIEGEATALPLIRIEAPDANYDYRNKYFNDDVRYHCPCGLPPEQELAIRTLALQSYHSIGCRGWARVDIILRHTDARPFLLEINTSPGMTSHSLVPMAAKAAGISYQDLCVQLLASARLDMKPVNDMEEAL